MSLYDIPDITPFDADPAKIIREMTDAFEAAYKEQTGEDVTLYAGDPLRIWLYAVALMLAQGYNLANQNVKRNLLKYADGAWLDNISATRRGPRRLPASSASAIIRFTFSAPLPRQLIIPAGTRISPEAGVFFAITETTIVPASAQYAELPAVCRKPGAAANGYPPGKINILADPLPYVAKVENIDASYGGADVESDENYRERIYLAPENYSTAGPELAYIYRAREYSPLIKDAVVYSPAPGEVVVVPVLEGDAEPSETFLQGLLDHLSARDARPLTDRVTVKPPTAEPFDIRVKYYVNRSAISREAAICAAAEKAVASYAEWQKSTAGRDINPDELVHRLIAAGVKRVVIDSPVYKAVGRDVVATADTIEITYGGLEDD